MEIRPVKPDDAQTISDLMPELGYEAPLELVRKKITEITVFRTVDLARAWIKEIKELQYKEAIDC